MKILAGIPSKLRSSSGKIADTLAEVCDQVIVVSQGASVEAYDPKVFVYEKPLDYGLVPARNFILKYAIEHDFDIVIECDDDLKFNSSVVSWMIRILQDNPTLGTISSSSRAYHNWNKEVDCTKPFILTPCPAQLWGITVDKVRKIGLMDLDYVEDREYGLRLWNSGYASGILRVGLEYTHNPFIARTSKTEKSGGQAHGIERYEKLGKALAELMRKYPDLATYTQSPFGAKGRTFSSRHNWNVMLKRVIDTHGYALNYEDSKGRKL